MAADIIGSGFEADSLEIRMTAMQQPGPQPF